MLKLSSIFKKNKNKIGNGDVGELEKGEPGKGELLFKINFEAKKPELPEVKDETKLDLRYGLIMPYAYAHLYWDEVHGEVVYSIEEPNLDVKEKEVLNTLEQGVQELIDISFINVDDKEVLIEYLEKNIKVLLKELGIGISRSSYLKFMYYIYRDFIGLNKIEPVINDQLIEDIECNGVKTPVYIVHRKFGSIRTNIVYDNFDELVSFVEKLAQKCGKYISYANPIMDGRLPDSGARVNATYTEDISSKGPTFSIRLFTKEAWSPVRLMQVGSVSAEILAYLWILIEHGANILIVGGTGSGKTTLLNCIASFIKPEARVITIEDTREIRLVHENWLPSVARMGTGVGGENTGEITMFDLLKASFRQRPDYVIVGEIRGAEAFVLFQGMASGHSGISTMHADDVKTVIRRLETTPINLSPSLVETLDVICLASFAKVKGHDTRKVRAVQEIISIKENGDAEVNVPFQWDASRNVFMFKRESIVFKKIVAKKGISLEELKKEFELRRKLLNSLYKKNLFEFEEVQKVINEYYKNKEAVMKRFLL
ncbi:type II/IV secretion system ATPase subunit [Candidatus Woesearchaeota archaeon]|nr:type II/IV secretion system ATPase subunit [Candidatus Woesearchaeota archaeon]